MFQGRGLDADIVINKRVGGSTADNSAVGDEEERVQECRSLYRWALTPAMCWLILLVC